MRDRLKPERMPLMRRVPLRHRLALAAVGVFLLLIVGPSACEAQSTAFGKILYAPDEWWNRFEQRNHLTWIDNTEEGSSAGLALITIAVGKSLSAFTPMSYRTSRKVVGGLIISRSIYGVLSGETHRYRAHAKHVTAVSAAMVLRVRWEIRW